MFCETTDDQSKTSALRYASSRKCRAFRDGSALCFILKGENTLFRLKTSVWSIKFIVLKIVESVVDGNYIVHRFSLS